MTKDDMMREAGLIYIPESVRKDPGYEWYLACHRLIDIAQREAEKDLLTAKVNLNQYETVLHEDEIAGRFL